MRFASVTSAALVVATALVAAQSSAPVHRQRFAMWTVVDILAYHPSRSVAETAISKALDEVE
jgi:hypothetical protein